MHVALLQCIHAHLPFGKELRLVAWKPFFITRASPLSSRLVVAVVLILCRFLSISDSYHLFLALLINSCACGGMCGSGSTVASNWDFDNAIVILHRVLLLVY